MHKLFFFLKEGTLSYHPTRELTHNWTNSRVHRAMRHLTKGAWQSLSKNLPWCKLREMLHADPASPSTLGSLCILLCRLALSYKLPVSGLDTTDKSHHPAERWIWYLHIDVAVQLPSKTEVLAVPPHWYISKSATIFTTQCTLHVAAGFEISKFKRL